MADPHDAEIPDLKKAAQERAARPAVSPVRASPPGRWASLWVPLAAGFGLGLVALGAVVLRFGEPQPDGSVRLGRLPVAIHIRPAAWRRLRAWVPGAMPFFGRSGAASGPAAGGAGTAPADAQAAMAAAEEALARVGAAALPAGAASVGAGGAASAAAPAGAQGLSGPTSAGGAAKAAASLGRAAQAPGFRPRAARAAFAAPIGRRGPDTGKGDFSRPGMSVGAAANAGAGGAPAEVRGDSLGYLMKEQGPSGGAAEPASAHGAKGAGSGAGGGGGNGGASGSGPGAGDDASATDSQATLAAIQDLVQKSTAESDKAVKDREMAAFLTAGGQLPQAAYYAQKSQEAEKRSKQYADQARAITQAIAAQASGSGQGQQGSSPAHR